MPSTSKQNTTDSLEVKKTNDKAKGRASKLDEYLGRQVRVRRNMLGMSQERLAELLGLTFQQVQKYEHGKNRISASRLFELSKILGVPIDYFFRKIDSSKASANSYNQGMADQDQESFANGDRLYDRETINLIRIYYSIDDPKLRKNLFTFMKSMADNLKADDNKS